MRTRGKSGFMQPVDRLNLNAAAISPLPQSVRSALVDPNWRAAMQSEFDALKANDTWSLVPRPSGVNIVTGKWVFRHKFLADGTLDRYKARWVLRGFTQRPGIDYDETFSPVVKPATVRVVLSLALSRSWPVHQLDVKNAFLHGHLTETVYCSQPYPDHVCRLNRQDFSMTDMGPLHHFLGISVERRGDCLFLSQRQYLLDILDRAGMRDCKPCSTPVETHSKLSADGTPVTDATHYRSIAGALQYLTFTRPDIAFAVQQVCLFMHDPREPHLAAMKHILRYLQGSQDLGLHLSRSAPDTLTVYSDADWAGCPDTHRSTSGFAVFLGDNLISWSAKRQATVSRSSAEAEYHGVANGVAEACWLRQLLGELRCPLRRATIVYCDNISAVYLSTNPVQHQRTEHVEIDLHFVRERVALGEIRVLHVPTSSQYADIFTKGLPTSVFTEFRSSLNVRGAPSFDCGGV
jgi:hypothetical protein